jgi:prolipoprotein diacylglyceryltransferase
VTASIVAGLLEAPAGRWMHALVLPMLLALAGGKAAMILGGGGQGQPWDGDWATAYAGPGPWGSLAPGIASHPSQAYEALATVAVLLFVAWLLALGAFSRRTGSVLMLGVALWAVARAVVASTWRDPVVVGPLRMEQVVSLALAAGALVVGALMTAAERSRRRRGAGGAGSLRPADVGAGTGAHPGEPAWPDPRDRPRI